MTEQIQHTTTGGELLTTAMLQKQLDKSGAFWGGEYAPEPLNGITIDYCAFSTHHEDQVYAVYIPDLEEETIERAVHRLYAYRLALREREKGNPTSMYGIDGWFYPVVYGTFPIKVYDKYRLHRRGLDYWRVSPDIMETLRYVAQADGVVEIAGSRIVNGKEWV